MPFSHLPGKSTVPRKVDLCCALNTGSSEPPRASMLRVLVAFTPFSSLGVSDPPVSCRPYSDPPSIEFLWGVWQKLAFPFILWRICSAILSPELSFIVIPSLMDINKSQTYQLNASLCLEDAVLLERTSCVLGGNFAHGDFLKVLL